VISQDELRASVGYEQDGRLIWLVRRGSRQVGYPVGCVKKTGKNAGYGQAEINGKPYGLHRLVWFYHHGTWPKEIDHINGIRTDNRIENLRPANRHIQMQNIHKAIGAVGLLGVSREGNRFKAAIWMGGKQRSLGRFKTAQEASDAYWAARRERA
jgi:hypothetical protein